MIKYRWEAIALRCPSDKIIRGAEVGVWNGKNAEQLLRRLPLLHLSLVDRWAAPDKKDSYYSSGAEMALKSHAKHKAAYEEAMSRVRFAASRVDVQVCDSGYGAELYPDKFFDFVFIDADHSREGCYRDIVAWCPKVKKDGFIGGHDFAHPDQGDVKGAVLDYFGGMDGIELDVNRTWFRRVYD